MPKCCVKKCKNNTLSMLKKDGVSYFRFPGNNIDNEKWRKIIAHERGDEFFTPNSSNVICSDHFLESDIYHTDKGYRKIRKHAFPQLGVQNCKVTKNEEIPVEFETSDPLESTSTGLEVIESKSNSIKLSSASASDKKYFNRPEIEYYKKKLFNCQKKLDLRTKEVQNLRKRTKRLKLKNASLKSLVYALETKNLIDKALIESSSTNEN